MYLNFLQPVFFVGDHFVIRLHTVWTRPPVTDSLMLSLFQLTAWPVFVFVSGCVCAYSCRDQCLIPGAHAAHLV